MSIQKDNGRAAGRSAKVNAARRSAIAKAAATKRWDPKIPVEDYTGVLTIGDREIQCAVLTNGTRVLSLRGIALAFGGSHGGGRAPATDGGAQLPRFLASKRLKASIPQDLLARLSSPIEYRPKHGGRTAYGYEANLLPKICGVILDAYRNEDYRNAELAEVAEVLVRGFAEVGIIALVDEATGYQKDRKKDDLSRILEAFVAKELRPWVRTFSSDFYEQMFRLRGLPYPDGTVRRPRYFGTLTTNLIYDRLAPGVREELKRVQPRNKEGKPTAKLFQKLTANAGYPKLKEHLGSVTMLMRLSNTWDDFEEKLNVYHPKWASATTPPTGDDGEDDEGQGI